MKFKTIIDMLFLIGVAYLFSMCSTNSRKIYDGGNETSSNYDINHYIDTVCGHVILTTVCNNNDNYYLSVSTLELKDN